MALRIGPYELRQKVVRLRFQESPIYEPRRDEVMIYYFVDTRPRPVPPPSYEIIEHVRYRTLDDEAVAAAFVDIGGLDLETAAAIVAANKRAVERLSSRETARVYVHLLHHLFTRDSEQH